MPYSDQRGEEAVSRVREALLKFVPSDVNLHQRCPHEQQQQQGAGAAEEEATTGRAADALPNDPSRKDAFKIFRYVFPCFCERYTRD